MTDATRRVTQWLIGVRGEVPLVEALATAEDVQNFVCGHVRWSDGTPGPAVELEDSDWTTWIGTCPESDAWRPVEAHQRAL